MSNDSTIVRKKLPCTNPECGSSDAAVEYSNGRTYCFSCKQSTKPLGQSDINLEGDTANLKARGLTEKTARLFGVIAVESRNPESGDMERAIAFPYYSDKGEVIGQKLRFAGKVFHSLGKVKAKGKMFGQNLCSKTTKLVITEGEMDALTVKQVCGSVDVVSLSCGASSTKQTLEANLEFVSRYDEIVLLFDNDKAGLAAVEEAVSILPIEKVFIGRGEYNDPNEALIEGGEKAVGRLVYKAGQYNPIEIVSGEGVWNEMNREIVRGVPYPFPTLNNMLYGIRNKELVLLAATAGAGKSSLMAEIAYALVQSDNSQIGYIALEEDIKTSAGRFISLHQSERTHLTDKLDTKKTKKVFDEVVKDNIHFINHFGSMSLDRLLQVFHYLAKVKKCKYIFLDHLTILLSGMDFSYGTSERQLIDYAMTRLRSFVEEAQITLFLVCHINKGQGLDPQAFKEGQIKYIGFEEGGIPTNAHLRGSGGLGQLPDTIITAGRKTITGENKIRLWITKNRFAGITGQAGVLLWDENTGRLTETDDDEEDELAESAEDAQAKGGF